MLWGLGEGTHVFNCRHWFPCAQELGFPVTLSQSRTWGSQTWWWLAGQPGPCLNLIHRQDPPPGFVLMPPSHPTILSSTPLAPPSSILAPTMPGTYPLSSLP